MSRILKLTALLVLPAALLPPAPLFGAANKKWSVTCIYWLDNPTATTKGGKCKIACTVSHGTTNVRLCPDQTPKPHEIQKICEDAISEDLGESVRPGGSVDLGVHPPPPKEHRRETLGERCDRLALEKCPGNDSSKNGSVTEEGPCRRGSYSSSADDAETPFMESMEDLEEEVMSFDEPADPYAAEEEPKDPQDAWTFDEGW